MNKKAVVPDKSFGGTFIYDKDGTFVEHQVPTKPRAVAMPEATDEAAPATESEPASSAEPVAKSAKKRGQ